MTPIHKIGADFKELRALDVTCTTCGAVFSLPLSNHLGQNADCLSCHKRLWGGEDDRSYQRVRGLMNMLHQWMEQEDKLFRLGFSLSLDANAQ